MGIMIILPWADKIKERLEEKNHLGIKIGDDVVVFNFIKPILEFAEQEEKRIEHDMETSQKIDRVIARERLTKAELQYEEAKTICKHLGIEVK